MIKVNLLPVRANQKKEKLREQIVMIVVGLSLVVVGCAVAYTTILTKISQKNTEIAQKEKQIEELKKLIGEVGKVQKMQEELQAKLDVLDKLKAGKSGPAHLLDELSKAIPEKLWIDSFEDIGGAITLSGVGINEEIIAVFLQQLEASPYFASVELNVLELTPVSNNKLYKFKATCKEEAMQKALIAESKVEKKEQAGSAQKKTP